MGGYTKCVEKIRGLCGFKVDTVLPYRFGVIEHYTKCEEIDTINCKGNRRELIQKYLRLQLKLAGGCADNHQLVIGKYGNRQAVLKFTNYRIYIYYNAVVEFTAWGV